ncbi:MAG: TIGR01777 family protein [Crocinitomicaceae bacterium TMED16]|nr:MAG: TIGR01777 family protein [Crocinitomicaceae bacterium TMED16]
MTTFLISGGRGLVGKALGNMLKRQGHTVYKLSRRPKRKGHIYWNPEKQSIEGKHLHKIEVIINLAGANIGAQKWSNKRKLELINSRVNSIQFLKQTAATMPNLNYYISASGINCYGYNSQIEKEESDDYGKDFLSELVKEWEAASNSFKEICPVAILRIALVVDKKGGALKKIMKPIKLGVGSPLGSGQQYLPWIHIKDLCRMFIHCIEHKKEGTFNAANGYISNQEFMKTISKKMKKPFFFPAIPKPILSFFLGEMSTMLTESLKVSNQKIKQNGFEFLFPDFDSAMTHIVKNED